ncbi:MAG: hypothetical protein HQL69_10180 [Magnetococcales bacterium]|nr:hypothetical protein [Magnetococcales bacterium]
MSTNIKKSKNFFEPLNKLNITINSPYDHHSSEQEDYSSLSYSFYNIKGKPKINKVQHSNKDTNEPDSYKTSNKSQRKKSWFGKLINLFAGLAAIIGTTFAVMQFYSKDLPEEVKNAPHLSIFWNSNYNQLFLTRNTNNLLENLISTMKFVNVCDCIVSNFSASFFVFDNDPNIHDLFKKIYDFDPKHNNYIFSFERSAILPGEKIIIPVSKSLLESKNFRSSKKDMETLLFPQILGKHSSKSIPSNSFSRFTTNNEKLLSENLSEVNIVEKNTNDANGLRMKAIVTYSIGSIKFTHILIGGMYYQTYTGNDGKFSPVQVVIDYWVKGRYSLWNKNEHQNMNIILLPQQIKDQLYESYKHIMHRIELRSTKENSSNSYGMPIDILRSKPNQ